ncbi:dihydrolipoamide dehydrogenase [Alkalispirochaeta sphaeroplastigenens]|uniref:Dihydrolipoyl dehydrogenase n=1 Tax=Alkalispirochaeta sphaeroplastigenens TaxID=1187066 RepID=A0A2S4JG76_9SPIO|nr:dihydrolipoyl dehydrogenase [Alkalispirochaeta sphaeroplastigenens]POQ98541.1 dihydrolipoamide dehydrogenase [Alkalispirochaeta sphaeroplastigenens]
MSDHDYDVLVLGAGPGGYVAAIRASQLGLRAGIIEREAPGGVCLNWGCIPSKALIHQAGLVRSVADLEKIGARVDLKGLDYTAVHRKSREAAQKLSKGVQALLKKNRIDYIAGTGVITGPGEILLQETREGGSPSGEASGEAARTLTARYLLIATGSHPRELPGFEFDHKKVLSSRDILGQKELPQSLVILGAGAIGMEFAYVMNAFGVQVTVVEMMDQILPLEDEDAAEVVAKAFKRYGITVHTGTRAISLDTTGQGISLVVEKAGSQETLQADQLLVAVGRAPNTTGIGLETVGVALDRGFVTVGDYCQTSVPGIYAIGDVTASPLLAHVASKEGEIAVEHMAGESPEKRINPGEIPSAVYCEPQVASFGLTERAAREQGVPFEVASFPYRGAGKSVAVEKSEGLVKIIYDGETREILGGHVVGADATELIHEILLAKKAELLPQDLATMIHAHPTLSEAVMEAARKAEGWAIHG